MRFSELINMCFFHIKKHLNILKATAFVTYKEWAAYRSHMFVSLFTGPVYFMVQYFIWNAVYGQKDTINGFTLPQMLKYYAIVTLIHYCIMDFADWNLQMLIHTGKFTSFMLRPVNHVFFALSQKIGHRILGFCIEFIPVYLLFAVLFRLLLIPYNIIWSVISIMLGFIMMFLTNYCIGITGFWLIKTGGVRRVFLLLRDIFAGAFIPLTFFPDAMQKLLMYLPFQYMSYVPARVFIGTYELAGYEVPIPVLVTYQATAVILMWTATVILYALGVKKYTGVGA